MASPHPFHERPGPVSDTVGTLFSSGLRPPPPPSSGLPPPAYAFCSVAASLVSMVKMAS